MSNMTPDYEVKLLMDPTEVLGPDHKLKATVLSALGIPTKGSKMSAQFFDTDINPDTKDIYKVGWSSRVRKV